MSFQKAIRKHIIRDIMNKIVEKLLIFLKKSIECCLKTILAVYFWFLCRENGCDIDQNVCQSGGLKLKQV